MVVAGSSLLTAVVFQNPEDSKAAESVNIKDPILESAKEQRCLNSLRKQFLKFLIERIGMCSFALFSTFLS